VSLRIKPKVNLKNILKRLSEFFGKPSSNQTEPGRPQPILQRESKRVDPVTCKFDIDEVNAALARWDTDYAETFYHWAEVARNTAEEQQRNHPKSIDAINAIFALGDTDYGETAYHWQEIRNHERRTYHEGTFECSCPICMGEPNRDPAFIDHDVEDQYEEYDWYDDSEVERDRADNSAFAAWLALDYFEDGDIDFFGFLP
jgi:hypothetical protein